MEWGHIKMELEEDYIDELLEAADEANKEAKERQLDENSNCIQNRSINTSNAKEAGSD